MKYIYDQTAFDPANPVGSWWFESVGQSVECSDLAGEVGAHCEVAVIGAGYTGLSAAYHLVKEYNSDVRVLDASYPGFGCSGRNGGFVGGEPTKLNIHEMIQKVGLIETKRFFSLQRQATDLVAEILKTENIDADKTGSSVIEFAHKANRVKRLREDVAYVKSTLGVLWEFMDKEECRVHGLAGPQVYAGMRIPDHFCLNPMKYVCGLARAVQKRGAIIYDNAPVVSWRKDGDNHVLVTPKGELHTKRVIIATNGYTAEDTNIGLSGRVLPALSNILITRPLSSEEQAAQGWTTTDPTYDSRKLVHYVRLLPDGRFLFGGRGGWDASPQGKARMRKYMERQFREMFPAWAGVEFTHFWNGFVCLTYDRVAHVGNVNSDDTVWSALAYHGNGVSAATAAGRLLAQLTVGEATLENDVPTIMQGMPPRFPFPALRTRYLRSAYWWYHIKDEWF